MSCKMLFDDFQVGMSLIFPNSFLGVSSADPCPSTRGIDIAEVV